MRASTLARLVRPVGSLGLPGFFAVVVEPLHRLVSDSEGVVSAPVHGCSVALDLDEYAQRRIFYGTYEVPEARLVKSLLARGDVVVDVGANIGFFTLLAARAVGAQGHVLAIEPVPANAAALVENVTSNHLLNVEVRQVAVDAAPGIVRLGVQSGERIGGTGKTGTSGGYTVGGAELAVDANAVTLDELVQELGRPVRLVKLDVEGYEPRVLRGFASTLGSAPPDAILIEANASALAGHGASERAVWTPLLAAGYRLHRVGLRGRPRPWNGGPIRSPGGVANILALRPGARAAA